MRRLVVPIAALGLALALAAPALGQGVPVQPGSASAKGFLPAAACTCHGTLSTQWSESMHERALYDPVFQSKVADAERLAGPELAAACLRCHSPIGNILRDPKGAKYLEAAEGVTCMFCHQVVGNTGTHGNTSQLIVADLTRRAQHENPDAPHAAASSAYYKTSEFCGDCHDVRHPGNGLQLDATYSEWKASSYAKQGKQCQDCHMSMVPGVPGPSPGRAAPLGPIRHDMYQMTFIGANVGQGPPEAAVALLQSAASLKIAAPSVVTPGSETSITVTVTNKGAGHDLPTGVTEERQMVLSVYAVNNAGNRTKIAERHFGTVYKGANGAHPVEVWDATGVYSDDRIPAGGSASLSGTLKMPLEARQTKVVAELTYRSLTDELAAKAQVDNPTTVMVSASKTAYMNESLRYDYEAPVAPVRRKPRGTIWTPLLAALAFAGMTGFVSVGIMGLQKL
jgi:hypothetical protein